MVHTLPPQNFNKPKIPSKPATATKMHHNAVINPGRQTKMDQNLNKIK